MKSVLQDWVMNLSLRQQGVIVLALRGPDGVRKEDDAKPVIRTLRALVMNSGREGKPMALEGQKFTGDSFMRTDLIADEHTWNDTVKTFYASIDQYNIHFIQHLLHAFAVVGCYHPSKEIANRCFWFYTYGVEKLHMKPETRADLDFRLRDGVRQEADE